MTEQPAENDHQITLTTWDLYDGKNPAARAVGLWERSKRFPMDEAATAALFRFAADTGRAAELLHELPEMYVLRTDETTYVLVEANPLSILLEDANRA